MPEVELPSLKDMLGFVAFLKGEEKTTDISFQVCTALNDQQEGDSYSSKGKSFPWGKQGSQAANPISQHSKKRERLHCCQSSVWQDSATPEQQTHSSSAVSLYQQPARETDPGMLKPAHLLHWSTPYSKGRGVLRNFGDSFLFFINTQPCPWHS